MSVTIRAARRSGKVDGFVRSIAGGFKALLAGACIFFLTGAAFGLPISGTVTLMPVIVTPVGGVAANMNAQITQDMQYTNQIYSQIGITPTVLPTVQVTATAPADPNNAALAAGTWTYNTFASNLNGLGVAASGARKAVPSTLNLNSLASAAYAAANGGAALPANVIPIYYVQSIQPGLRGAAQSQAIQAGQMPGLIIAPAPANDTVAHELGHALLNTWFFRNGPQNGGVHANYATDLMAPGAIRTVPGALNASAPVGNLDTIGVDPGPPNPPAFVPSFGYIDDTPGTVGYPGTPKTPQYVMPEVNAMYGAKYGVSSNNSGGTAVNTLVTNVKSSLMTLTVGNTALIGTSWGQTNVITPLGGGDSLTVNEMARVQSVTNGATQGVEQFAFEYRDPTGFPSTGILSLGESGMKNLNSLAPYTSIVPNSLQILATVYNPSTNIGFPTDNIAVLNSLVPNVDYTSSVTLQSNGQINWTASINNSALQSAVTADTDVFVEFSATVPEPMTLSLLIIGSGAILARRSRRMV